MIDNNSTDNPLSILEPYIKCGLVTYSSREERHKQSKILVETYGSPEAQTYTWLINADLDEFWFATQRGSTLKSELANPALPFADADAIVGLWYVFGPSGKSGNQPPFADPTSCDVLDRAMTPSGLPSPRASTSPRFDCTGWIA